MNLIYAPFMDDIAYGDDNLEKVLLNAIKTVETFSCSNELMLYCARALMSQDKIDRKDIFFYYQATKTSPILDIGYVNEYFQFDDGHVFDTHYDHYLDVLLENLRKAK